MNSAIGAVLDVKPSPLLLKLPPDVASSAAAEAIDFAEDACGIYLDDWQRWVVELALSERADGSWSAFEVGLVCPRQNGKNFILEVVQIACIYLFGDQTLVHSAHKFDTSVEHFNRLKWLFENTPELSALLLPDRRGESQSFVNTNGKEHIRFNTGQRILFKARYRGSGRGFVGDKVFLDEAYDLPATAIGAMIPTLSTRRMAQVWYTSSSPHASSTVLHAVRNRADAGDDDDRLFYVEWGNPPEAAELAGEAEMEAIRQANPAIVPGHITEEYIRQEIRTFSGAPELVDEHRRERLGIATPPIRSLDDDEVISEAAWLGLKDEYSRITSSRCFALDVSPDRRWATIGAAGRRADGQLHVEAFDTRPGTDWVLAAGVKLWETWSLPIRIEKGSPAGSFVTLLRERGVDVVEVTRQDHAAGVGQVLDAVENKTLRHLGASSLNAAVKNADVRPSGDVEVWARRSAKVNITPLVAVTIAIGGVPDAADGDVGFWNGDD